MLTFVCVPTLVEVVAGVVAATLGAESPLPLIVTVWTEIAPSVALVGPPMVTMMVSSGSCSPSLTTLTVIEALVDPAGMVSGDGVAAKSAPDVAVPPIVNGTVTSTVVATESCAVT